ncbi:hypothetical protein AVEN_23826-1 [Araneus ventricosus]|uniref:Peptidase A2 domain-containing protein n=1 Tax=Araneus ventricosus TaxID=182803 RepID=A0A4Y2VTL3_ARAVE|nr:hypothetical protein AVEN_23826-1 [Araneus ventricosus]
MTRYCRDRRRVFTEARLRRQPDQSQRWDSVSDFGRDPESNYQRYRSASPYPRRDPQCLQSRSPARRSPIRSIAMNGHIVNALVDSRADYSVVSEQLRIRLRTPMFSERNPILRTACGNLVEAIRICMLQVDLNGVGLRMKWNGLSNFWHSSSAVMTSY